MCHPRKLLNQHINILKLKNEETKKLKKKRSARYLARV